MSNASVALALLGGSTSTTSYSSTAVAAFARYNADPEAARLAFYERADTQEAISDFQESMEDITSVEDLLDDREALEFVLTAFGLESEIDNPGKLKAIFNSDPDDDNSYANRLNDTRYGEMAEFFNAINVGVSNFQDSEKQTEVIDKYLTNAFEIELGNENPAARSAVYFLRKINEIDSSLEILGDSALRSIVTTALGLPAEIANQSVSKQESLLDAELDWDRLNTIDSESEETTKSALDYIEEDIAELTSGQAAVTNASTQLTALQEQLEALRSTLQDYDNITNTSGVLADEIPVQEAAIPQLIEQQGLISAAELALSNSDPNMTRLNEIFAEAAEAETQEELDALKNEFNDLVSEITADDGYIKGSNYTNATDGTTENLLLPSGDAGVGIDAMADTKISTVVKEDGTAVVTTSYDMSDFLTSLDAANTAFQAVTLGSLSSGLAAAKEDFTDAKKDFASAEVQIGVDASSFSGTVSGVNFGYELNSQELSQGISAVDDALTRLSDAASVITEIRELAVEAQQNDADLDDINAQYQAKVEELTALINEAGSASDGTNTFTFDNLLTSGTLSYEADASSGTTIDADGGTLDTDILSSLPTTLTADNANGLLSKIDTTYTDALSDVRNNLVTDRKVFDFAANTADPLGAIDAEIREIRSNIENIIEEAGASGDNLLDEYASDLKITLSSLGTTLTIDEQSGFADTFEAALSSLQYLAVTGADAEDRETLLNDALFAVGSTLSKVKAEQYTLNIQQAILDEKKAALTGENLEESLSFLQPLENTSYAVKFIQQYLVKVDLEAAGGTSTSSNAYLVDLYANATSILNVTS